ncbi:MAG TPA: type II secretion system protein GspG [Planctomycetota bacterium]|nr:type II secretion system protein GspG [Planctomycetota bacterium]
MEVDGRCLRVVALLLAFSTAGCERAKEITGLEAKEEIEKAKKNLEEERARLAENVGREVAAVRAAYEEQRIAAEASTAKRIEAVRTAHEEEKSRVEARWNGLIEALRQASAEEKAKLQARIAELDRPVEDTTELKRFAVCVIRLQRILQAVQAFERDMKKRPAGGNAELVRSLSIKGPRNLRYLELAESELNDRKEVLDSWGRAIHYEPGDGERIKLYSFGPDGNDDHGLEDDVNGWGEMGAHWRQRFPD